MSFVAEFTIPPDVLPFGDTLKAYPDMRIEVERIVPTHESALPFFWVWGHDPEIFMDAAETEPEVSETRLLESVENGGLFRAEWSPSATIIKGFKQLPVTIVESEGTSDRWRFEVRAQDRNTFREFQEIFQDQGVPISLTRLYDLAELVEGDRQTLTPKQRETLLQAYQTGYFDKPRKVTQSELGEQLGVSYRAISERLRRGTRNLIAATLLPSADE